MNAHAPQTVEAHVEQMEIAAVSKQMISPRLSKPLITIVQDTLVGVNRLTRPTEFFTQRDFMNLLVHSKRWDGRFPPPAKNDPVPMWSGLQVVSALLPSSINVSMGNKVWDKEKGKEDPNYVIIRNGEIKQGILDGDIFDKALINILYNDYSPEITVDFIDSLQSVVATYLQNSGFSVGLSDLIADSGTLETIRSDTQKLKSEIEAIQLQVHMGLFDNSSGRSNQEEFENRVFQTLDKVIGSAGKTGLKSLASNNRMVNMVKCGSKGADLNIAQMVALLGQQSSEGKRIGYGFQDRTLPHFKRYDDGAEARGFIQSSFVGGLKPHEFFFHAMTGRDGLIDTAVKSVTGDTLIVIIENGTSKTVKIGDWIDSKLETHVSDVEYFPEEAELEMLQLANETFIPSMSPIGNVQWGKIAAVTRHNPGDVLYNVTTLGGRSVIVTASKSLLIWNASSSQFEQRNTPDVQIGDFMPVTMSLPESPSTSTYIDMSEYLPKTEYLYGTDFIKAQTEITSAMIGRQHIPPGWWANNKTFTLPYTSKGKFVRTLHRSNISNISEGFIYPFSSNRDSSRIPEQFELNEENGIFIGLFLAEGNADIKSGYTGITNNNPNICAFVTEWFAKHRITTKKESHTNSLNGVTTTVRGFSTVMATFMNKLCGHGASNKHVPSESFTAPITFVKGILNGYFSGDGTLSETSIESGSSSKILTTGITMLLSRIGVFAKTFVTQCRTNNIGTKNILPSYRLSVRAQWARKMADIVEFIDDSKNEKRKHLRVSESHRNFTSHNDVVLDSIVNIEMVSPERYPKMYDLTVPETFTFGLANGLQVYDTADSGYIQRQLVKTMEDLIVEHDGSVRDSGGLLVQTAYGDDGTSATKIENQPIGLGNMSDVEIRNRFAVEDVDPARSQAFVSAVMKDRDLLVMNVWGGKIESSVQSAVHLPRLIANTIIQLELAPGKGTAVTGDHVLTSIDSILQRTNTSNLVWAALLRFHLNPRDLIGAGFTAVAFDWMAEQIVVKHMKSWVVPGEMCGIIAAQSLGEPTTQMSTLKTCHIITRNLKNISESFSGSIGTFIDKIMEKNSESLLSHEGSDVLNLPTDEWAIMGVTNTETTCWKPISQISRHPANGGLVRVTTKSGRKTTATLTHSFLRRTTNGITDIKGADLKVGLRIPVASYQPVAPGALEEYKGYALTREFGWLVGIYLADGSFSGNTVKITKIHPVVEERIRALGLLYDWRITTREYPGEYGPGKDTLIHSAELKDCLNELGGTGSYEKHLSAPVFQANKQFIAGLLSGYFDGDGNINTTRNQIRVSSRSKQLIHDIARLLPVCGVFATLGSESSVRIPGKTQHTLSVLIKHAARFQSEIGLHLTEKAAALQEIVNWNSRTEKTSVREDIDMISELGDVIAETGRILQMPGQSRLYGRYASERGDKQKTAIGRRTLQAYIEEFKTEMANSPNKHPAVIALANANMEILESAANSHIIWDEITQLEILPDPQEHVYDFTVPGNDSFMVDDSIFVHNTLNSVDWDTEIMIAKDGNLINPKIGEFIDNYITDCEQNAPERIQHLPNEQLYVSLEGDGHNWQAVSCDENGEMMWTTLEAITRHPVVNDDGTNTILEVTTESGRTVKATKGLSFLTPRDGKIVSIKGADLQIGDELPIANTLAIESLGLIDSLDVRTVLSPREWLFGTEVATALSIMKAENERGNRHWFTSANGSVFTVPYERSDSFRDAFTHGKNMHAENIRPGYVYPKKLWKTLSQIPDRIPLTREFGFFCGAYVAEGSCSPTQINITNNDDSYLAPIRSLLDSWGVGHHTVSGKKEIENTGITGHTQSLIIHSTLITAVMRSVFGANSYEKRLPDWVLQASDEFVKGLVDGYVSGDGSVSLTRTITMSSVSDVLITRLTALFGRYGIFTTRSSYMPKLRKFKSVRLCHRLCILPKFSKIFATHFSLVLTAKQERLNEILKCDPTCRRNEMADLVLDKVKSITETLPIKGWMYDITVENTRNFMTSSLLSQKDTFHLSGVAAKSGMTRGVPRLKELLKVTQNPKATSLTIFMRHDLRTSKEHARKLAQELEFTLLSDLVTVARIYYDPRDSASVVEADRDWLAFFTAFEETTPSTEAKSPWVLRIEMDREKMFNKNITMDDIVFTLKAAAMVDVMYTDHNSTQMIIRVRPMIIKETMKGKDPLDDLTLIKMMQTKLLSETLVCGIPGLKAVTFRAMKGEVFERSSLVADGAYQPADQFVLDTLGSNFLDVMIHPNVDGRKLLSNHVHDVLDVLGIEAARQVLFREIYALFEQAAPVNYRHVALLCDTMTNRGRLMSADRYGVNKKKIGPLAKASFEQTEDIMTRAALFGELDPITGVSANIMTGQPIRGGTTFSKILLDEEALQEFTATSPAPKTIVHAPKLTQSNIAEMLNVQELPGCRQVDLRLPSALPPVSEEDDSNDVELPDMEIVMVDE